jgi:hypothetical protein
MAKHDCSVAHWINEVIVCCLSSHIHLFIHMIKSLTLRQSNHCFLQHCFDELGGGGGVGGGFLRCQIRTDLKIYIQILWSSVKKLRFKKILFGSQKEKVWTPSYCKIDGARRTCSCRWCLQFMPLLWCALLTRASFIYCIIGARRSEKERETKLF